MDKLWAPWRFDYIKSAQEPIDSCFLCDAVKTDQKRERLVLFQNDLVIVVMNKFPYNNGHLLVAVSQHIGNLKDLTEFESSELWKITRRATEWLGKVYKPQGYNIGMNLGSVAGAGLPDHLHIHIVPRWNGDMNFMPVVTDTKVLSESLSAGWEKLRKVIQEL